VGQEGFVQVTENALSAQAAIRPRDPIGSQAGAFPWPYHGELLATPVPRYTSYPTAAEFADSFGPEDMGNALDCVPQDEPVSLYLHIPYCHEICWYCGCNTGAANRSARLQTYLEALHREIEIVGARLDGRGRVQRVAFGGGSPNAIAPEQFDTLVDAVRRAFRWDNPVLSVEIDPRGFDMSWAQSLRRNGVERASLGVQTFAPAIQAAIGRVQPREVIHSAVELLREAGVRSINFDLMYGLPGQSDADLIDSIDAGVEMGADRFAVFGYAHVPHLIPRQRRIDASNLPGARARFDQAELAHGFLTGRGFLPVGFDHFALPDDPMGQAARAGRVRRNFQGFTDDQADVLIGLGASAISAFPDRLLQNEKNTGAYREAVSAGRLPIARGVGRDAEDQLRSAIIEQLLTAGTAALPEELNLSEEIGQLAAFQSHGLVAIEQSRIRLPAGALPYARSIAARFDRHRNVSAVRFSSAI
jgi:oxygen-independent coproporphyrinogen-3 oxidase